MALGAVMLDLYGLELSSEEVELLQHPGVGGVIFFARNYESIAQLQRLIAQIRAIRSELLLAVDQEGGRVQRFKSGFTRLPAMQQFLPLYRKNETNALSLVNDCGWLMASELLAVGVDFSFAPVLDLDSDHCSVIANRSFSPLPEEATALAGQWLEGMQSAGMATTGKHFPGHGGVKGDSHLELPVDERSLNDLLSKELIPFTRLFDQLNAIMPAHIVFPAIDKANSVGFSSHWLRTILRQELAFDGVIFSDDLSMEGAASAGSYANRAASALAAGCDMLLVCNNREGAMEVLDSVDCSDLSEKTQNRLTNMRASKTIDKDDLRESVRWQQTHQFIQAVFHSAEEEA